MRHVCCAAAAAPAEAARAQTVRQGLVRRAADGKAALFAPERRSWVLGAPERSAAPDTQPRMRLPRVQPRPSTLFANLRSTPRADTPPERAARDLLAWQEDRPKTRRSSRLRSRRRLHAARAKRLRVVPRAAPAASAVRFRPPPALQPPARLCRLPRRRRAVRAAPSRARVLGLHASASLLRHAALDLRPRYTRHRSVCPNPQPNFTAARDARREAPTSAGR